MNKNDELFLDIETLPSTDDRVYQILADSIKVPGNMSKPETIAKWVAEEKPKLIDEAMAKTSLDGTYGRVCCITYAFGDESVQGHINRDEKEVLAEFFEACMGKAAEKFTTAKLTVVGHAVNDFDLRFLWQRAVINGVIPPSCLPFNASKYSEYIRDTMTMWNPSPDKRISLHKLCLALGVESPKDKNGMNGSDVALLWQKREYKKILAYGCDDTDSMRSCYRKMTL